MDELTWDFELTVPAGWYVYDPDPSTRRESTSVAVEKRIRALPELAAARDALVDMLLCFWADAETQEALAAAVVWEPGDPVAVAANLTALAYSDAPADFQVLLAGAARAIQRDVRPREVDTVELAAGPAVRVRALRESDSADSTHDAQLLVDVVEHWVPVPRHTDVLLLRGSTPCLDVADELAEVFDQIACTLRFTHVPAQA